MSVTAKPEFHIDKLHREHDLSEFDCSNATLTEWLKRFAWTNLRSDSAKTYVALDGNRIVGYYALTTGSVHKHESPIRVARGLANHPIGIVLLARLAVDLSKARGLARRCCSMLCRGSKQQQILWAFARCWCMLSTKPQGDSIYTSNLRNRRLIPFSYYCCSRIS